jgi:ubiquinone/menaquinone biosynthesis C-methylase UbiE
MEVSRYFLHDHGSLFGWIEYQPDEYSSFIMSLLYLKQDELILDNGTGNGRFSVAIAGKGAKVISLDINRRLLKMAAKNLRRKKLQDKAHLVLGDIQNLPFKNDVFDKILSVHNLWYVANYEKSTAEMFRALKIGGRVIIDHLNLLNWNAWIGGLIYAVMKIFRRKALPIFYRTPRQIIRPFREYPAEIYVISFDSKQALSFRRGVSLWSPRFIVKSSKSH